MASEFLQAITAGKAAVDGLKLLATYADEVRDIHKRGEFMRIVGELSIELAETQIKLAEKFRENESLREQVKMLQKENESLKNPIEKLVFKHGLYYTSEDDGPYCTGCYDSKGQRIRVAEMPSVMRTLGKYKCPVCGSVYPS
ncbi:MAG TPA: hypothetical protein V6C98_17800 [Thermosynechococcaceae cyanobacterium]